MRKERKCQYGVDEGLERERVDQSHDFRPEEPTSGSAVFRVPDPNR